MSLVSNNVRYVNIKDGKLVHREGGKEALYDYLEGELLDITTPTRTYNGEEVRVWYFKFKGKDSEDYILSIGYPSGVAKTILNALASTNDYKDIKILPYERDGYTKVVTFSNSEKLSWKYEKIPPIEYVEIGGKKIKDDSKRMVLFDNISKEILQKLQKQ